MKNFMDENFLLQTETAQKLYHEHAAKMPIIDYHGHLIPQMVADDYKFKALTERWLGGDHYKWRAMRTNGVDERFCTGKALSLIHIFRSNIEIYFNSSLIQFFLDNSADFWGSSYWNNAAKRLASSFSLKEVIPELKKLPVCISEPLP